MFILKYFEESANDGDNAHKHNAKTRKYDLCDGIAISIS